MLQIKKNVSVNSWVFVCLYFFFLRLCISQIQKIFPENLKNKTIQSGEAGEFLSPVDAPECCQPQGHLVVSVEENQWPGHLSGSFCSCRLHSVPCVTCAKLLQSCPTLSNPMDCSLPGSSVCGMFQARILEWVAISGSRGSS